MDGLRVPYDPVSAGLVRHRLIADLDARAVPGEVVDAAALVASELVGNALRHGAALPWGGLLARWSLGAHALHLEVVEGGPGPEGAPDRADDSAETGRGLALVDALCESWGRSPAEGGTAVWCELAADPDT